MVRHWLTGLIVGLISYGVLASEFELSSSVSTSRLTQNDTVVLTLSVNGADRDLYSSIRRPDLSKQFSIVSTSQSSSFSYVNGVSNRSRQYRYTLRPIKPGIFIIDPFSVVYQGKTYSTKPIRMVVTKGTTNVPPAVQTPVVKRPQPKQYKNIFIETKVSTTNIYLGQSIDYSVKFYRRVSLWSSISIDQQDMLGVWQNALPVAKERVVRKNGQRYYELELMNKKIRPLNAGNFEIPPLTARFMVDPFSGEYELQSEPIALTVNDLPQPIPSSFTGAIGHFDMVVGSPNISVDSNTINLKITITGSGNIAAIQAPIIQDTPQYRVLVSPVSESPSTEQQFDYVIIPKITGDITMAPIEFSYFSESNQSYMTLTSRPIKFYATLDSISPTDAGFQSQEDIQFLQKNTVLHQLMGLLHHRFVVIVFLLINACAMLILVLPMIKQKNIRFMAKQSPKKRIIRAIHLMSDQTSLNDMEKVLIDVLVHVSDYSQQGIHPKDVHDALINAGYSDAIVQGTLQWIKNSQRQRYSDVKSDQANHSNADSLKRLLNLIVVEKGTK